MPCYRRSSLWCRVAVLGWPDRRLRRRPRTSSSSGAGLSHRALCAQRHAVRQRLADYLKMINARDGGINGVKLTLRGMRDRLRHRPRRRVLRAPEEQGPDRRAASSAVHRHHLRADREGTGRQDPAAHHGLRPRRRRDGARVHLELPAHGHLLDAGGHDVQYIAKQEGGFDKLKGKKIALVYHDSPVRQGADPAASGAGEAARLRARR